MLVIIVPVGMKLGPVLGSLLGCGLLLLTVTVSVSAMTVSVSAMTVSMSAMTVAMTSVLVSVTMVMNMSVSMTSDGLDVLQVYSLLLQGQVLILSVGSFTPLEGGSLLCPMGVAMTMIMGVAVTSEDKRQEGDTQGEDQPHSRNNSRQI